jgi:hypothetical protein
MVTSDGAISPGFAISGGLGPFPVAAVLADLDERSAVSDAPWCVPRTTTVVLDWLSHSSATVIRRAHLYRAIARIHQLQDGAALKSSYRCHDVSRGLQCKGFEVPVLRRVSLRLVLLR